MAKAEIESWIAENEITVESVFVPFSKSRNKAEKHRSLNWTVSVFKAGRLVVETDYSAGEAHCPSYKQSAWGERRTLDVKWAIELETEAGFKAVSYGGGRPVAATSAKNKILPDAADVLHSLASDSDVIDASSFEDWADVFEIDFKDGEFRAYRLKETKPFFSKLMN